MIGTEAVMRFWVVCSLKVKYRRGEIKRVLRVSDEDQRSIY